jgi:hypothetical protein
MKTIRSKLWSVASGNQTVSGGGGGGGGGGRTKTKVSPPSSGDTIKYRVVTNIRPSAIFSRIMAISELFDSVRFYLENQTEAMPKIKRENEKKNKFQSFK